MALLQSTDHLLVQRSGASYKATFEELSQSLGLGSGGDLSVSGDLDVKGEVVLGTPNSGCANTLAIHNATTINCDLDVTGDSSVGGAFGVVGALSGTSGAFSSTLSVGGAATLSSTAVITGAVTANGGVTVTNGTSSDSLNVSGLTTLTGAVTAGSTLKVVAGATLDSTLNVGGAAEFASTVTVDGTTTSKGKLTVQDDIAATGEVSANSVATTTTITAGSSLAVGSNATVGGTAAITGNVTVGASKVNIVAATGDANYDGTVEAAFFKGDGSQLTNLQIPGSLDFKGSIDCVTQNAPVATSGDFYLNTGTGNVKGDGNWTGMGGDAITEGEFVYYDGAEWTIGGGNDDGFVTLTTTQTIDGAKTFSEIIVASGGITALDAIAGTTLGLSGKATSADTEGTDPSSTLTTKGYVDALGAGATTKEVLKSGDYLTGADFDGSSEITFNVEGTEDATPLKLVARDVSGDIAVHDIAANDYAGKDVTLTNKLTALSSEVTTATVNGVATNNSLVVTTSATVGTTLDVTGALTGTTADFSTSVAAVAYTGTSMTLSGACAADSAAFTNGCSAGSFSTVGAVTAGVFDIDSLDPLPVI